MTTDEIMALADGAGNWALSKERREALRGAVEQLEAERDHWREQAELSYDTIESRDRNITDILAESERRQVRIVELERELESCVRSRNSVCKSAGKVILEKNEELRAFHQAFGQEY